MDATLLDTDILSELLKQKHPHVVRRAREYFREHGQFAFSAITRYEVLRGLKEKKAFAQLKRFITFCDKSLILPLTQQIFDYAADLWVHAREDGLSARDADLLIAATAVANNRVLVTGNIRHFKWIPQLRCEDWRAE